MEVSNRFERENLVLAEDVRKAYFDKSVEKRDFCVGAKVLVKLWGWGLIQNSSRNSVVYLRLSKK